jgi:AsmA protein
MRGLKILSYLLGGLAALVALLLLAVALFVNPNDYKGRIAQEVKASTGRDLILQGDIKLSVFPWIALQLGPLSLGNPQGFGTEPFLSLQHAALRVKLLPLLRKQLQVGRIEIDGLDLRLAKNAAGKGNWQDFGQNGTSPAETQTNTSSAPSFAGLGGIRVRDSRISDEQLTISNLDLEVGSVSQRATVPIKTSFDLDTGPSGNQTSVKGALTMTLDAAAKRYRLEAVALSGELKQRSSNRSLPWKFLLPAIDADLTAQTLRAAAFTAQAGAAQLSGALAGEKILDAPVFSGAIKLEPLMLREFLAQLGVDVPKTRDPKVLAKFALSSDFSYASGAVRLQRLDFQLDDTQLRGTVSLTNPDTDAMSFDLNLDQIDLDRYLAPVSTAPPGARTPAAPQSTEKPTPLPTSAVKALDLNGSFSVGSAKVSGMTLSKLQLGVKAQDGIVHLAPIKAALYGGEYSGTITYNAQAAVPSLNLVQQVTGVDMTSLLKDGFKSERFSGRGNASVQLAGSGLTTDALLKNSNGRIEANLANGAVNGIDLWYELNLAQALLAQQQIPAGSNEHRTKFDSFKMSADIAGGIATTKDLNIASQLLRVTGAGSSNLITEAIDYHLVATILKAPPAAGGSGLAQLTLADIPVEISGTLSDPKVRPDVQAVLKSKLKQKLQDTLKDKLQGIFGR